MMDCDLLEILSRQLFFSRRCGGLVIQQQVEEFSFSSFAYASTASAKIEDRIKKIINVVRESHLNIHQYVYMHVMG